MMGAQAGLLQMQVLVSAVAHLLKEIDPCTPEEFPLGVAVEACLESMDRIADRVSAELGEAVKQA